MYQQRLKKKEKKCADLRQHKAVVALVARILRFVAHGVEEEHRHELSRTAAWCWVTEEDKQKNKRSQCSYYAAVTLLV